MLPNSNVIINLPIKVGDQIVHPLPNTDVLKIATDITVQKGNNNPTGCNAPGLPAYQINIPINDIFYDPPTIGYSVGLAYKSSKIELELEL
ncbi:hypothetical protein C2G38_2197923 [Gigaspora rosea]|uniref:Uncharacterized protein n=1 Tax=Gigaspora rosea TaxID=44941 RepID=A0A397V0H6_9GLOM|nr:hypothetical protein C2G38_2197923 [Gigaspora rosea]